MRLAESRPVDGALGGRPVETLVGDRGNDADRFLNLGRRLFDPFGVHAVQHRHGREHQERQHGERDVDQKQGDRREDRQEDDTERERQRVQQHDHDVGVVVGARNQLADGEIAARSRR